MDRIEIKVSGHLDINWDQWLHGFSVTHGEQGETILVGPVRDQADLYGFIAKLRDLGVELISVNRLGETAIGES